MAIVREDIVKNHPTLFPRGYFSFECDDGWMDLLNELCDKLEPLCAAIEIDEFLDIRPYCVQCKEKYGSLCFYISHGTDEIFDLIYKYQEISYSTCELCGLPGTTMCNHGWYSTYCKKCNEGINARYRKS
jgi:hypothetical protein